MQFGWLTLSLSPSAAEDATRIGQQIELACEAEALGFGDIWLTEHYFTGESVYNDSLLFASALAMKTSRARIGFAVVQMPFHHPVRLATQLALLDNLSHGRIDVGIGKGTAYNEYEFVGHGLRSHDARERMDESVEILQSLWEHAWREAPFDHRGRHYRLRVPQIRPRPVQQPGPPLWRSVISPGSFEECGRLGVPILTARLPVDRIKERWALYRKGLDAGGHDEGTQRRLMAKSALWRNVYVAASDAQAEDELAQLLTETRAHMMHVRDAYNPADFEPERSALNAWTDPNVPDSEAIPFALRTGSLYGSPKRVREQVAELADTGVQHLLCQTGFGAMSYQQQRRSIRRFGEEVMPAFQNRPPSLRPG
jgi:alkanesulfonate monooxygenase SsuD/methylene tetrahydromethanopterin reductase-like flavin-dependent oxidoreductase (luciferase family)